MEKHLTKRQFEVLRAVCQRGADEATHNVLFISPITTRNHLNRIFRTLGITGKSADGKIGRACYQLGCQEPRIFA